MHHSCATCLFAQDCDQVATGCKHYAPLDEEVAMLEFMEEERKAYRRAWEVYTAEDDEPYHAYQISKTL